MHQQMGVFEWGVISVFMIYISAAVARSTPWGERQ